MLHGCQSLKEKRAIVRSLRDRLTAKFKVSVSETDYQDARDRAEITAALVATDRRLAEAVMEKMDHFVDTHGGAVIVNVRREVYR